MAKDNKKLVQANHQSGRKLCTVVHRHLRKGRAGGVLQCEGFIILRPYGQAIWELIQKDLDARFKLPAMRMWLCRC